MSYESKFPNWRELVVDAATSTKSATEAAAKLGVKYTTYKKYATKYDCFFTNQGGKGIPDIKPSSRSIPLEEILLGLHPQYQSNKLRIRLLKEGLFMHECASCGLEEWLDKPIPLELEHKDGNSSNHILSNLELLCPNCHAFTSTYRGKNTKKQ
jgi:hypothetical protein